MRDGRGGVAGHLEQVAAHGVEAIVAGHARIGIERLEQLRPARGPCTMAAAIAWLSVTIGLSDMRLSRPYKREDLRPVGVLGARRFVVERGDRRLQLIRRRRRPATASR